MEQLKEQINERIPKKTQKILIYLISVLIVVVIGMLVFKPLLDNAMTSKKEVEKLEKEVTELRKLDAAKETNKKNAERYENDTKTILAKYPSDVFPEDMIMVLSNLETQTGILFTDVEVQNNNYVTENNDKTSVSQANNSKSTGSSGTSSGTSTSNSSKSNSSANSSSNSSSNSSANTSNSSANSSSNSSSKSNSSNISANASKANGTNGTNSTATAGQTAVVSSENYDLYVTPVDLAFEVSYTGIKQLFSALFSSPLKKNAENVTLTYDNDTGRLLGTMTINFYTMRYKDNTVNGHEAMPGVNKGTANIFHSIN